MRMRAALIAAVLLLAACGERHGLTPAPGRSLPPKPATAKSQPTPAQLLTPSTTIRPARSDELITKSEQRRDDRFDLPPQ